MKLSRTCLLGISCILLVISVSCTKNGPINYNLQKISSEGGECLILADSSKNAIKPYVQGVLYKLNIANTLSKVSYLSADNTPIENHFYAENIYQVNEACFLLYLSVINTSPKELTGYLVKKEDGSVLAKLDLPVPMIYANGTWTANPDVNAVKSAMDSCYYFRTKGKICRIKISSSGLVSTSDIIVAENTDEFTISVEGNVMIDNTIYEGSVPYTVPGYESSTCVAGPVISGSGFEMLKYTNTSVSFFHEYIKNNQITEDLVTTVDKTDETWIRIGQFFFRDLGMQFYIFDLGLINIKNNVVTVIKPSVLGLKTINYVRKSRYSLYIEGNNVTGANVLLKVNPLNIPLTYTKILDTDKYLIKQVNMSENDEIGIICTNSSDKLDYFIFITGSLVLQQLKNPGMITSQLISVNF